MAFKWTSPKTWVALNVLTAAELNTHVRDNLTALNGYVVKSADESVTSSAVLQNDNHLAFSVPQAGSYKFRIALRVSSAANAAGDIQLGFTFPAGTLYWGAFGLDETLASGSAGQYRSKFDVDAASPTAAAFPFGASTTETMIVIEGLLVATGAGTLQFQWAQNTSNANATNVLAGSHLTYKQTA